MGAASNARVVAHDPPLSIRIRRVIDWIASHLKGVGYRSHFVVTALLAAASLGSSNFWNLSISSPCFPKLAPR
jgi:hypothetical protein